MLRDWSERVMNEAPDFLSSAHRLVAEAQALGALFHTDGSWSMGTSLTALPSALADRLRVHRRAVVLLMAKTPDAG